MIRKQIDIWCHTTALQMALSTLLTLGNAASAEVLPKIRAGTHFYWSDGQLDDFCAWWNTTTYALSHPKKGRPDWGSDKRKADMWDAFQECAHIVAGEPAMACKACHRVLGHPSVLDKGNTSLDHHFTTTCAKQPDRGQDKQLLLPELLRKVSDAQCF
jgi:hypothetical protein